MNAPLFVLLASFLISPAEVYPIDLDMKETVSQFLNEDLITPMDRALALANKSLTLTALVGTVINELLEKKVNSSSVKVEVYPTMSKDFVVTKASHYIAGPENAKILERIVKEALVVGLVRVGIEEQEKAAHLDAMGNNYNHALVNHYYGALKKEHPEWDEQQVIEKASEQVIQYLEANKEVLQQELKRQLQEYVKTDEFKTHLHNRWMYYTTRHLGGVGLSHLSSKALKSNDNLAPLLYNGTNSNLVAGIRATIPTLPVLTALSSKLHPNVTVKHPSVSLEGLSKPTDNGSTMDISVGGQVTIFHSELLKVKLKASTNFSGSSSCGISLEVGM